MHCTPEPNVLMQCYPVLERRVTVVEIAVLDVN